MSLKFQLQSGKKVEIDIAPVEVCWKLYCTIISECKGVGLDLTVAESDTVLSMILKNIETALTVVSSESVLEATKDCCAKVVYDKQRFSMDLFEKVENRRDFIPVMALTAMENIRPFFNEPHTILNTLEAQFLMS